MAITASRVVEDAPQIDGRRWVTERHIDHLGASHHRGPYMAVAGFDAVAQLPARAAEIALSLRDAELERLYGDLPASPAFVHVGAAQFRSFVRARFRDATGLEVGRVAAFLATLSNAQLKGLFGVDDVGVATLRNRLQNRADRYVAVSAEAGE